MKRSRPYFLAKLIAILILSAFSLSACAPTHSQLAAQEDVSRIKVQFLRGNYDSVISNGRDLDINSRKEDVLQALYYVGVSLLVKKRCAEARRYLDTVQRHDRKKKLKDAAALRIADSYYIEGKRERAFSLYARFLRDYPKSQLLPSAYRKLAEISQSMGRFEEAEQYRELLRSRFPSSIEAHELELEGEDLDYFTVQVGAFFDEDNAQRLKLELEILGFKPTIAVVTKDNARLYRIRVGQFKTQAEAAYAAGQLEARGYTAKICS